MTPTMTLRPTDSSENYSQDLQQPLDDYVMNWVLVGSPLAIVITILYLVLVVAGIRLMRDRPAFQLTTLLRVYNVLQIAINLFLMSSVFQQWTEAKNIYFQSCSAGLYGPENAATRRAFYLYFWIFLVSKISDLVDTIFFVLRKKNSHISFLHVYHHGGMVFFTWVTLRYANAHQGAVPGIINVFVHVVMYTYYFLATFGEPVQKYLWWKQHLTKLQLGQFTVILMYLSALYYNNCPIPRLFTYIWTFNVTFVFLLFLHFYIKTYIKKPLEKKGV